MNDRIKIDGNFEEVFSSSEPELTSAAATHLLSARETPIVKLIADGRSNKEIAHDLAIAPETVKSHLKRIFVKLNVAKRAQAVSRAQTLKLVDTRASARFWPAVTTRHNAKNDRIHELLHRNLGEVFGESNAARRRVAIDELYADDCVLHVPPGTFIGRAALDTFAGDLRATHPDFVYTPLGEAQAHHNTGRIAWGSGRRGEVPAYTGLDVIIIRDGKIAVLYMFLDTMSS